MNSKSIQKSISRSNAVVQISKYPRGYKSSRIPLSAMMFLGVALVVITLVACMIIGANNKAIMMERKIANDDAVSHPLITGTNYIGRAYQSGCNNVGLNYVCVGMESERYYYETALTLDELKTRFDGWTYVKSDSMPLGNRVSLSRDGDTSRQVDIVMLDTGSRSREGIEAQRKWYSSYTVSPSYTKNIFYIEAADYKSLTSA